MKYTITTPPTDVIWQYATIAVHIRVDDTTDRVYINSLQDAATDYAQDALSMSLLTQTITAVYYVNDVQPSNRYPWPSIGQYGQNYPQQAYQFGSVLSLPRGPVQSIASVVDAKGTVITAYTLERQGYEDLIRITAAVTYPLTVVYTAGYDTADLIPPAIKHAILVHIGTLYENRESVAENGREVVPHSLDAFYARKAHKTSVG